MSYMLLFTYVALSILLYWIHLHCISRLYDPQKGILQHYGQILCHWISFRSFQFLNSSRFTKGWVLVLLLRTHFRWRQNTNFALSTDISCGNIIQRRISTLEDHPSHPFLSPPVIILYAHTQLMGSVEPDEQYERFLMIDRSRVASQRCRQLEK